MKIISMLNINESLTLKYFTITSKDDWISSGESWKKGCLVKTCRDGSIESSFAPGCKRLVDKIIEDAVDEKQKGAEQSSSSDQRLGLISLIDAVSLLSCFRYNCCWR